MRDLIGRVWREVEAGILMGVRFAIAVAIVLLTVAWLVGDYQIVRGRAQNGQAAFEYIQQQLKAQAAPQPAVPSAPVRMPGPEKK